MISNIQRLRRGVCRNPAASFAAMLLAGGFIGTAKADVGCVSGARVTDAKYCKYFARFTPSNTPSDPRINAAMGLGPADQVRSMAMVVAIGDYPNLPAASQLKAAQNDGKNLTAFLTENQRFDEVVVIRDKDATKETIGYFLGNYFRTEMGLYPNKNRFLFAFSGHGIARGENGDPAKIALSAASSETDYDNMLDLTTLRDSIYTLDRQSFHVLLLLNSCYGGAIFSLAPEGGNENDTASEGARGITAAQANNLAYALPGATNGSIFFDTIIKGVTSGEADFYPPRGFLVNGKKEAGGGYVRFGPLLVYLSDNIAALNSERPDRPFRPPWAGIVEPIDGPPVVARGGFFFLTPALGAAQKQELIAAAAPIAADAAVQGFSLPHKAASAPAAGAAPVSPKAPAPQTQPSAPAPAPPPPPPPAPEVAAPPTPDRVTFYSPFHYPVRGVDTSHYGGVIDWATLKAQAHVSFVYMKATEGATFKDPTFSRNWRETERAGLYRGAYHFMTFCTPVKLQYANIIATVPNDPAALPLAIDLGFNWISTAKAAAPSKEHACYSAMGPDKMWRRAEHLAAMLAQHYGKQPVIYINGESGKVLANHFPTAPIWVQRLGSNSSPTDRAWTFWQYATPALGKFDFNAFSGSEAAFEKFRTGRVSQP